MLLTIPPGRLVYKGTMPALIERYREYTVACGPDSMELATSFPRDRTAELAGLSLLLGIDMCPKSCVCERRCILLHPHPGPHECSEGHLWA